METIGLLEVEKADTELTLQELHQTAEILENNFLQTPIGRAVNQRFLKEVGKDIEFNEVILHEIKGSIGFEDSKRE